MSLELFITIWVATGLVGFAIATATLAWSNLRWSIKHRTATWSFLGILLWSCVFYSILGPIALFFVLKARAGDMREDRLRR